MTEIRFCLLGSLMVRRDGVEITVPRGKQRVILAMLLLNAGRVVRLEELAQTLWESGPPPSGLVAVQNYVMRLRKTLADGGRERIITQPRGYLIRVQASELDVPLRFPWPRTETGQSGPRYGTFGRSIRHGDHRRRPV